MTRRKSQAQIDAKQDTINKRQDLTDKELALHNLYQNIVLTVYAVMLAGMFVLSFLGYFAGLGVK